MQRDHKFLTEFVPSSLGSWCRRSQMVFGSLSPWQEIWFLFKQEQFSVQGWSQCPSLQRGQTGESEADKSRLFFSVPGRLWVGTPSFLTSHQELVSGVGRGEGLLQGLSICQSVFGPMAFLGHVNISLLSSLPTHSLCIQLYWMTGYVCLRAHMETHVIHTNPSHSLLLESWKQCGFWNYLDLNFQS